MMAQVYMQRLCVHDGQVYMVWIGFVYMMAQVYMEWIGFVYMMAQVYMQWLCVHDGPGVYGVALCA